jgi:nucleotide-binding universal stress UspA family protein
MFRRIVVGIDEHVGGRDAIALAKNLLDRDGEIMLAHVRAHDRHVYRGPSAAYEASGRARAAELLEKVRDEAGIDACLRWRVACSVERGLHELCEVTGADLLAVGSSQRGLVGRVLLGDDMQAALDGAPCAIAIAPTNYSRQPVAMREIGVGYNGTPESEHALELARRIAAGTGAKLSAFEAVSLSTSRFEARLFRLSDAVDTLVNEGRERITALGGG